MSDPNLLRDCLAHIEDALVERGYGFPWAGLNPKDFTPDPDSATEEEMAAWTKACADVDAGTYEADPTRHSRSFAAGENLTGDGKSIIHISATPWGLGTYTYRREPSAAESALLARLRAAVAAGRGEG